MRPVLGSRPASKIEPLEIQGLYADMQERGLSARTVRFTHAVLRAALHQAVKWKLIPQNPALSVDLVISENQRRGLAGRADFHENDHCFQLNDQ